MPPKPLKQLSPEDLARITRETAADYGGRSERFWHGTRDHDVSQNIDAFTRNLAGDAPQDVLDIGCGPGRDLMTLTKLGHRAVGLDGTPEFVEMARRHSGCEVWQQDFLKLDLPPARFDGIFANAVLFHVPSQELPRVLLDLRATLRADGVLFCSNPRGPDVERQTGARYGAYYSFDTWCAYLQEAGFALIEHYYRPPGLPRAEQPWLATVWKVAP